ncbi:MAG: hypothetical protein J3K34DRAFT_229527, partial [Monoraphidium minutum]
MVCSRCAPPAARVICRGVAAGPRRPAALPRRRPPLRARGRCSFDARRPHPLLVAAAARAAAHSPCVHRLVCAARRLLLWPRPDGSRAITIQGGCVYCTTVKISLAGCIRKGPMDCQGASAPRAPYARRLGAGAAGIAAAAQSQVRRRWQVVAPRPCAAQPKPA